MQLYHGSPELFSAFDLSKEGEGTGVKFGFGVYLTESEASAVHYSQPRNMEQMAPAHYLYTIEIPDLTPTNHLVSAKPVNEEIVSKVQAKLGVEAPAKVLEEGKEFRKWVGMTLLGTKKNTLIAGIVRDRKIIIPSGDDYLLGGDKVVVLAANQRINKLADILK